MDYYRCNTNYICIGINLIIVYCITLYTEVIFYRLFKYYSYMNKICDLINIPQERTQTGDINTEIEMQEMDDSEFDKNMKT